MWHLYHLIRLGDHVRAVTVRRVQKESATGALFSLNFLSYLDLVLHFIMCGCLINIVLKMRNPWLISMIDSYAFAFDFFRSSYVCCLCRNLNFVCLNLLEILF